MKTLKPTATSYTALHACLEVYCGKEHASLKRARREYPEPEQGFRTVPFRSNCPLQLNYMRRRKPQSLISPALRQISSVWRFAK